MPIDYIFFLIGLFNILNRISASVLISIDEQLQLGLEVDYKCDFDDRELAESVRFIRSPINCRIYHICAFFKQYTLTCPLGLLFDEVLLTCNLESAVDCYESVDSINLNTTSTVLNNFSNTSLQSNISSFANIVTNFPKEEQHRTLNNLTTNTLNTTATSYKNNSTVRISLTNSSSFNRNDTIQVINSTFTPTKVSKVSFTPTTMLQNTVIIDELFKVNNTQPNAWWFPPKECIKGFEHKIPHEENCGLYHDCQIDGQKQEKACTYPQQYDVLFGECRPYDQVDCGKRTQAKDLCDYSLTTINNKSTKSSEESNFTKEIEQNELDEMKDCTLYPSCKNLKDGLYPLNNCKSYFQCKDERTLSISNCPSSQSTSHTNRRNMQRNKKNANKKLRFNFVTQRCDLIDNVSYECGGYTIPIDIYSNKMKCPDLKKYSSLLKQRYRMLKGPSVTLDKVGNSGSSFTILEYKDLYFSHPNSCILYLECNNLGEIKTYKCSNKTYFSPFYQMCVHPSIANCFKYNPLSSNQSVSSIIDSNEREEEDEISVLSTTTMTNARIVINTNSLNLISNETTSKTNITVDLH